MLAVMDKQRGVYITTLRQSIDDMHYEYMHSIYYSRLQNSIAMCVSSTCTYNHTGVQA